MPFWLARSSGTEKADVRTIGFLAVFRFADLADSGDLIGDSAVFDPDHKEAGAT